MSEEDRLVSPHTAAPGKSLRPARLEEFIGQGQGRVISKHSSPLPVAG